MGSSGSDHRKQNLVGVLWSPARRLSGRFPATDMRQPDHVLATLNETFQERRHGGKLFTIWYGDLMDELFDHARRLRDFQQFDDDFSIIEARFKSFTFAKTTWICCPRWTPLAASLLLQFCMIVRR